MAKYKFTGETKEISIRSGKIILNRIVATADFGSVKVGDIGGWIESKRNLPHKGNAWVADEACVYGNARVCNNAYVRDNARVYGNARVYDNAYVRDNARVYGNAKIYKEAYVCDDVEIYDNALISGAAEVYGNAQVYDNAKVSCTAQVYGNAQVCDDAEVYGNTQVYDNAQVCGGAQVCGSAQVYGNARIDSNAHVYNDANVCLPDHVIVIGNIGSRSDSVTFYRDNNKQIMVTCGCFNGNLEAFLDKVNKTYGDNKHAKVYKAAAEVARLQISL